MALGLNLSSFDASPVSAMASTQYSPSCPWGCSLPMQPVPDTDAWRCTGCGCMAVRKDAVTADVVDEVPADAIADSIALLEAVVKCLAFFTTDTVLPANTPLVSFASAIAIENRVRSTLGLLRSAPITSHANAVHAVAIAAAARVCDSRARSLYHESNDVTASLEAKKCATAIRRIAERVELTSRPELVAPQERS
jgi:hypothetical protein